MVSWCRKFKRLELAFQNTPDEMLRQLSEEAGLESLVLLCCPTLTDATARQIMTCCRRLKLFVLARCNGLTAEVFKACIESGSKAKILFASCNGVRRELLPEDLQLTGNVVVN